jgi:hypothetical protein
MRRYLHKCRFLLANFQLTYVLRETAQANMRKALKSLPSNTSDAYKQVMTRIKDTSEYSSKMAVWALSWIFHACRPLQMDELREALVVQDKEKTDTLDEADMEDLLAADIVEFCQSLLVYEESSGVVRFSHPTVQEFLESQIRESQIELPVVDLAKTCLAYLGLKVFEEGPCPDDDTLKLRITKFKFSGYAAQSWSVHSSGQAEDDPDLRMAILRLLESKARRDSMNQIECLAYGKNAILKETALHILARNGLATTCKFLLEKLDEQLNAYKAYVADNIGLMQGNLNHNWIQ